jgi:hypothetical protein
VRCFPLVLGLAACDPFVAMPTSGDGGFTLDPSLTPDPGIPSDAADLELSPAVTIGAALVSDIGGDGGDDLVRAVARVTEGDSIDIVEEAIEIRPNVLYSPTHTITVSTPTSHLDPTENGGTLRIGPHDFLPTPDATGDERPDAWLSDSDGSLVLVAGPLSRSDDDPVVVADVPPGQLELQLATDLDGDGDGEIVGRRGQQLLRCEGLFAGTVDPALCPAVLCPDMSWPRTIAKGDIDADGITDLLVAGSGTTLLLVDGNFADGEAPVATIRPHEPTAVTADTALLADLDADGYADLAWVEDRTSWSETEGVGVAILHAPIAVGSELDAADATLGIFQSSPAAVSSMEAPDVDGDGAASVVLTTEWRAGALLFDASVRGSLGPYDARLVLAADQEPEQVLTGELDGDDRDDLLLRDPSGTTWIYLGASLP